MIREMEKQLSGKRRVPIFAVSATLKKEEEGEYVANGFDGWLLKPVDFKRLNLILEGAFLESAKKEGRYKPEDFNSGGWFYDRANTV
jgi:CheY-like chemotaxis protein